MTMHWKIRIEGTDIAHRREHAIDHHSNNEETNYHDAHGNLTYIANFSKGLPHYPINDVKAGEVMKSAYELMLRAIASGNPQDFEAIELGLVQSLSILRLGLLSI